MHETNRASYRSHRWSLEVHEHVSCRQRLSRAVKGRQVKTLHTKKFRASRGSVGTQKTMRILSSVGCRLELQYSVRVF